MVCPCGVILTHLATGKLMPKPRQKSDMIVREFPVVSFYASKEQEENDSNDQRHIQVGSSQKCLSTEPYLSNSSRKVGVSTLGLNNRFDMLGEFVADKSCPILLVKSRLMASVSSP